MEMQISIIQAIKIIFMIPLSKGNDWLCLGEFLYYQVKKYIISKLTEILSFRTPNFNLDSLIVIKK